MNYFTSGIHGDLNLYKELKKMAASDPDNHLWIVGDILDGNTSHPEYGMEILKDIYRTPNVSLILGDHEYAHAMRVFSLSSDNPSRAEEWEDFLLSSMEVSGKPFMDFLDGLSESDLEDFARMLMETEATEMIRIGKRLVYMCHGAPALRSFSKGGSMEWQFNVINDRIYTDFDYTVAIGSDSRIGVYTKKLGGELDLKKAIIVTGQTSIETLEEDGVPKMDGLYYDNRKFCLNQGRTADDTENGDVTEKWTVLGIDSAGFITEEL